MINIDNLFFEYNYYKSMGDAISLSDKTTVVSDVECYAAKYARDVVSKCCDGEIEATIKLSLGISDDLKNVLGDVYTDNSEGYAIEVAANDINISSLTTRGLIYGISTLKRFIANNALSDMILYDYPDKEVRGYRVYLPGRESIDDFEEMIDNLVYYKYNSIIIEVGGAMEYKRHPEINQKWEEFASHVNSIPGEADRIQKKTPQLKWAKDSIHAENGGGSYLSQEQVRRIVNFCKEREINVIPEVPSLSHSDYIVMAHPDLNERVYDQYPDTYCPSDPKSYEILFDILDEVVEVFEPQYLNIGHDEVYSISLCDKCKGKDPIELFVGDIVKINDYLKTKNVKAMMWCDKLFNAYQGEFPVGGSLIERFGIPEMYPCRHSIPRDITLLNWYWSLCTPEEQKLLTDELGFEMIYGNYVALEHKNYRDVSAKVKGAFASNWGYSGEEYMQRNQQYYALVSMAYVLWSSTYNNDFRDRLLQKTEIELHNRYLTNVIGTDYIEIVHTTDIQREDGYFWCGHYIYDEDWVLGYYRVTYSDGTEGKLQVRYGYNISSCMLEVGSIDYSRTLGACMPQMIDGKLYYKTAYANPHPDKTIESVVYEPSDDAAVDFLADSVRCVKFGETAE